MEWAVEGLYEVANLTTGAMVLSSEMWRSQPRFLRDVWGWSVLQRLFLL
jgi:hypothetical protein